MADVKELFKKLRENPEELTEEELKELMTVSGEGDPAKPPEDAPPKPPEKARVTLEDGTVLEADSYEELTRTLTAKLGEHYKEPPAAQPTATPPAPPKFDMEEFTKKFVKDAREGMEYLETAQYGFPVSKAVPILVQAIQATTKKVEEIEAQRFLDTHADYQPSPENQRVIEGIIQQRGWRPGYQAYSDAFAVAKGAGMIKPKEIKREERKEETFVPPRAGAKSPSEEDLGAAAEKMPLDKLERILIESGYLKRGLQ